MVYPCDTFPLQSSLTWVMTSTSFYRDALCRSSCLTDLLRALFLWLFSTPSFRLVVIEVVSRRLKLYLVLQSKTLKSSEKIKVVKTCKKNSKNASKNVHFFFGIWLTSPCVFRGIFQGVCLAIWPELGWGEGSVYEDLVFVCNVLHHFPTFAGTL